MNKSSLARSTPEEQGMNTQKLCSLLKYLKGNSSKFHSVLILRHGYVIEDLHIYPNHSEVPYYLNCCTASILSALVGIALGAGLIKDVRDKLITYFPEYSDLLETSHKCDITIEDLLKMTTGLTWDDTTVLYGSQSYDERMHQSSDPVGFILEQPACEEPGKRYNHCIGAPHLLSALLQRITGKTAFEFAQEKLFDPLGITGVEWYCDKNGISTGGNGLSMTAAGLAKIGQLYLQKGRWDDVEIIPEGWVNLSTRKQVDTPEGPWSFYGNGYLWNINRFGGFSAKGVGGQYLTVVPNMDLVVVIIASLTIEERFLPETLMETYIVPAIRFGNKYSNDEQSQMIHERLKEEIGRASMPRPLPTLP